jgi:hypothetical protein
VGGARYCAVAAGIMCCVLQHEEFFFGLPGRLWVSLSAMGSDMRIIFYLCLSSVSDLN